VLNFLKLLTRWMIKKIWATMINPYFLSHNRGSEKLVLNFLKFFTRWMMKKFWATMINPYIRPAISAQKY
jgi:hypothetical protein